ncbi:MAG: putative 2-aminoethylphosphonate ABC transporter permease subunit [Lachnospiraceae bacterium]|nr:putative 2-aminoethylphosphonate ABC transporter permease subunit [Lachnospiraceae bacterium]MBP5600557.1 putative 2-aminoethylphosphonate ABC transporter permease subunit [Lachnospiraceae bacterium]
MKGTERKLFLKLHPGMLVQRILMIVMIAFFVIFLLMPMLMMFGQIFTDDHGGWVGLGNFKEYFSSPILFSSIGHSFTVSLITATGSTLIGLLYAYGVTRTNIRGKKLYKYLALLPIFIPTMVHGMALIYLFGKTGLFTSLFNVTSNLYGRNGIIMALMVYCFPQAYMVLSVALDSADNRLYEAAEVFDPSPIRTFVRVTLPSIRYGLINSFIACFTMSFTDFGAPEVVGGNYNVLATDIYREVVGQQKMSMGAVVGLILTIPAFISFLIDLALKKKNERNELSSKATAFEPKKSAARDSFYQIFCSLVVCCFVILIGVIALSSLVKRWPHDFSLTTDHFKFGKVLHGTGVVSFVNSFKLALGVAVLGTILVFAFAYLIEKGKPFRALADIGRFFATMPMALPGLVLGLGYIMFFNKPWIEIPFLNIAIENGFYGLYQTLAIMVLCTVIHLFSVTFVTATAALKKLDREYENVAESMSVPFWVVCFKVTLPMCINAILEVFNYFFVNTMVTVSAVVFLYTAANKPASIAILNMDDNGDYAAAAAMSILIFLINIIVRTIYETVNVYSHKWLDKWKAR